MRGIPADHQRKCIFGLLYKLAGSISYSLFYFHPLAMCEGRTKGVQNLIFNLLCTVSGSGVKRLYRHSNLPKLGFTTGYWLYHVPSSNVQRANQATSTGARGVVEKKASSCTANIGRHKAEGRRRVANPPGLFKTLNSQSRGAGQILRQMEIKGGAGS